MRKSMLAAASHTKAVPGGSLSEAHAISALAALAQPTRLAIFRLLIKHEPVGITAGVIAETIGAPHNTLSTHLAILVRAGLLRSSREGRTIIYRSDVEGMRSVIAFLVDDCCDGHPELCNLVAADAAEYCASAPAKTASRGAKKAIKRKSRSHDVDDVGAGGRDDCGFSRRPCRREWEDALQRRPLVSTSLDRIAFVFNRCLVMLLSSSTNLAVGTGTDIA